MSNPYAPPTVAHSDASTDSFTVRLPGVGSPVTIEPPGAFSGAKVFVGGVQARKGSWGKIYIPKDDGSSLQARVGFGLSGLFLQVDKTKYPVGPQNPAWMGVLVFAPIGFVGAGGALGGAVGAAAMLINRKIAAGRRSTALKAALMIGMFLGGLVLWLALAAMLGMALQSSTDL